MNSSFAFDNSLNDEILTVQSQVNGIHLEHKVEQLDSPSHKGSYDNYFIESDLAQDTSNFWDYTSSDKIITELQPDEVRWFYKSYSNKRWIEFCGYDSLNIEAKYQQYFNGDWKYYISKTKANTGTSNGDAPDSPDSEREKYTVVVRGGLYEVELLEKQCVSIYWPGEQSMVTRGSWFYQNGQPFDADMSDVMEQAHLELYAGHKSSEYVIDVKNGGKPPVSHTENFPDSTVMWYSPDEVYLYSQATPSKIVRSISQKLGSIFQKSTGYRLARGYKDQALETDRPEDISHLVFVVHGMGQKMDSGRIIKNATQFRESVMWLKKKYFASSKLRAEFFPVEWRSSLALDGDIVESITQLNVLNLRHMLNASAMDIMYYTSPIYGSEIQQGLTDELNRLYSMFVARNPNHNAKISIIAHSLGCVIVYDVITGWIPQMYQQETGLNSHTHDANSLRVPRGHHGNHLFPPSLCSRLYNMFHPSDPIAYRLEPLVMKNYFRIAPVSIHSYNASSKPLYCDMPLEFIIPSPSPSETSPPPLLENPPPPQEKSWKKWSLSFVKPAVGPGSKSNAQIQPESPYEGLEHRLDYALKDTYGGTTRGYLSAMTSHTAYWNNYDCAYFILTRLFPTLELSSTPPDSSAYLPDFSLY
ncbi:hypothetical protein M8J75_015110 [Diaphorina citri]|nr:hypothetical protein M8J75_015110 [Diaphorina citri]